MSKPMKDGVRFDKTLGVLYGFPVTSRHLEIPSEIDGVGVRSVGTMAFRNRDIETVAIPQEVREIFSHAFSETKLVALHIPEGVVEIGNHAFENTPLSEVVFPNSLKVIGFGAFQNTRLKRVVIPEGVRVIGNRAFLDCELEEITLPTTLEVVDMSDFADVPRIICPEHLMRKWKINQADDLESRCIVNRCDVALTNRNLTIKNGSGTPFPMYNFQDLNFAKVTFLSKTTIIDLEAIRDESGRQIDEGYRRQILEAGTYDVIGRNTYDVRYVRIEE